MENRDNVRESSTEKAKAIFLRHGGTLRMSEALRFGLSRWALYALHDAGVVERISRGVYRLTDLPPLGNPDLVTVALRVPRGVICLISALAYFRSGTTSRASTRPAGIASRAASSAAFRAARSGFGSETAAPGRDTAGSTAISITVAMVARAGLDVVWRLRVRMVPCSWS